MAACKTLVSTSLSSVASTLRSSRLTLSSPHNSPSLCFSPSISSPQGLRALQNRVLSRSYASIEGASLSVESID
ncbi:hypothetical protein L484_020967 [Morus notabilis]|uniref:Uncharacterized protein n=1 Tax=Morus notabilis TaxID=981085 RepID=W9R4L0_9ROSA|nr:hypothetical protein L484_020967 [Morus notabilis]